MKTIDITKWVTQQALADELGVNVQNVHNWVQRKKIDTYTLPGSTTVLVNRETITINTNHHKYKNHESKKRN